MHLSDIQISETVRVRQSWLVTFVRQVARAKPKTVDYRGRGIGTGLLLAILQYAREIGITEIEGQISALDWSRNPRLPEWYRKHGFSVSDSGKISLRFR